MVDSELHAMLSNDERHWWYRGRRRVLRTALDRLELPAGARALDAGCGSGRTLDELVDYATPAGVDVSDEAVAAAHARGYADVRAGSIDALPYPAAAFDLITCLDVLEHVPDDVRALGELRRVARPGAALVVTVPAYEALWSAHDENNLHYRRYRRGRLRRGAAEAGWQLVDDTHFNTLLLVPAAVFRRVSRNHGGSDLDRTPRALDRLLELPMRAEAAWLRHGGRLAAGLSILAVFTAVGSGSPGRRRGARLGGAGDGTQHGARRHGPQRGERECGDRDQHAFDEQRREPERLGPVADVAVRLRQSDGAREGEADQR
jgi:SAM-dependent methyltransferase